MQRKTYIISAGIIVAILGLVAIFGHYGSQIAGAYGAAYRVQLHLDETNGEVEALKKEVGDLEDMRALDEQRIGDLEARTYDKP